MHIIELNKLEENGRLVWKEILVGAKVRGTLYQIDAIMDLMNLETEEEITDFILNHEDENVVPEITKIEYLQLVG